MPIWIAFVERPCIFSWPPSWPWPASHDGDSEYRIHTVDGRSYRTTHFTVTDSTIVIRTVTATNDVRAHFPANQHEAELLVTLTLDEVESIERLGRSTVLTQVAGNTLLFVAVVAVIVSVVFATTFSSYPGT